MHLGSSSDGKESNRKKNLFFELFIFFSKFFVEKEAGGSPPSSPGLVLLENVSKIHGIRRKLLYLRAQEELGLHLGHVSTCFEPYKSIEEEIKSILELWSRFLTQLLFFSSYETKPSI